MAIWAPKPSVAPMMVALASNGVRLIPSMPRTIAMANTAIAKRHALAMTAAAVCTRATARGVVARRDPIFVTRPRAARPPRRATTHATNTTRTTSNGRSTNFDEVVRERARQPGPVQEVVEPAAVATD